MDIVGTVIVAAGTSAIAAIGATIIHKYGNKRLFGKSNEPPENITYFRTVKRNLFLWAVAGGVFYILFQIFKIYAERSM